MSKKTSIIIISAILCIFQACSESKETFEEPSIKYEQMVQVLRDVHIAEGSMQGVTQEVKDSIANVHYAHIFKIHGINEKDFYKSYDAFMQDPKIMEKMYDEVKDSIQQKQIFED